MPGMKPLASRCFLGIVGLASLVVGAGGGNAQGGRAEIEACLERTFPTRTSIQTVELVVVDTKGEIDRSRAKIAWKRSDDDLIAVRACFSEPPNLAGVAVLARQQRARKQPEIFHYLPALGQVRRIPPEAAAGSMFRTDFGYEDFAFLQGVAHDDNAHRLDDHVIDGRASYVLESRVSIAKRPTYERILYFVEQKRCTPLRAEFYEPGGILRKVLDIHIPSIEAVGERFVPMVLTMRDREHGSHTVVTVVEIDVDVEIKDDIFEPGRLQFGAHGACGSH